MGKILMVGGFASYLVVAAFAFGKTPDTPTRPPTAPEVITRTSTATQVKSLPPLVLPNVQALTKKLLRSDRETMVNQLHASRNVLRFWEGKGRWIRAPRQGKCWDVPWQRSCTIARASYRLHLTLATAAQRQLWFQLPSTTDWKTAALIAQRAYPGTYAWLMSCSGTEGGHGRWVPNKDGAPPGGWMQMYESTFWRMWQNGWYDRGRTYPGAITYLKDKGFVVPRSASSWYSPLGQALASAHGYTFGRRGEWHSSGCYIN